MSNYSEDSVSRGTNLTLEVSDFNDGEERIGGYSSYKLKLASYLRLGVVPDAVYDTYNGGGDFLDTIDATGEDLASKVTTFVDDSRDRGGSDSEPYYRVSQDDRASETKLLHTRGGWRDHTDGNRITTTLGDKVEVIGGNCKLVVMGRRQWAGQSGRADGNDSDDASLHWESSGAITYHYDQVPGQFNDVRWVKDDLSGVFRVKMESVKAHVIERSNGYERSWQYGPTIQTRVGSKDAYENAILVNLDDTVPTSPETNYDDAQTNLSAAEEDKKAVTWNETSYYDIDDDFDQADDESHQIGTWPPSDAELPNIWKTTWANSIVQLEWARKSEDYTGSAARRVPSIEEETYVETMTSYDETHVAIDNTYFTGKHYSRIWAEPETKIYNKRDGEWVAHRDGHSAEFWGNAEAAESESGSHPFLASNFCEVYLGGFESLRMGFSITTFTGLAAAFHMVAPLVPFPLGLAIDAYLAVNQLELTVLCNKVSWYSPVTGGHLVFKGVSQQGSLLYRSGAAFRRTVLCAVETKGNFAAGAAAAAIVVAAMAVVGGAAAIVVASLDSVEEN